MVLDAHVSETLGHVSLWELRAAISDLEVHSLSLDGNEGAAERDDNPTPSVTEQDAVNRRPHGLSETSAFVFAVQILEDVGSRQQAHELLLAHTACLKDLQGAGHLEQGTATAGHGLVLEPCLHDFDCVGQSQKIHLRGCVNHLDASDSQSLKVHVNGGLAGEAVEQLFDIIRSYPEFVDVAQDAFILLSKKRTEIVKDDGVGMSAKNPLQHSHVLVHVS
mmetsp:Transcript_37010/g.98602  ORF Transcript_37010/g.98602 Transcript_37010/m.98602 type:complete len:220 (-) Transcript_37010:207-866(-)